jgi:peptide-methionine (S)-S-oxide reductase
MNTPQRIFSTGLALCVALGFAAVSQARAGEDKAVAAKGDRHMEKATFAAGCFWGVEYKFRQIKGVVETKVGYTGGKLANPTYENVCTDRTGHAEAVEVTFDPAVVTYDQLLDAFWKLHNPTTPNRQGPDVGSQYRSVIFYHTPAQQKTAQAAKERLDKSGRYPKPVVTEIVPAAPFYPAEDYHQRYYEKNGRGACAVE